MGPALPSARHAERALEMSSIELYQDKRQREAGVYSLRLTYWEHVWPSRPLLNAVETGRSDLWIASGGTLTQPESVAFDGIPDGLLFAGQVILVKQVTHFLTAPLIDHALHRIVLFEHLLHLVRG